MTRALLFVLGLVAFGAVAAFAQGSPKIGYVDIQRVIKDSQAGITAKAAFERDFNAKKGIIDQKQSQLDKLKEEFLSKAPVMDEGARKNMADDIERREKELKRLRTDFRDELQKKDFELTQKILTELEGVLQKYGREKGYTMIFERTEAGIVFASPDSDITEEIIKAYDASKK